MPLREKTRALITVPSTPGGTRSDVSRTSPAFLAQVMGRNGLSWEEKFEWDVRYVETCGFWLDAKILLLTIKSVVGRSGVSADGEATMPEFNRVVPPSQSSH